MNEPSYHELLGRTDAPAGSSWGVFGADDELGTLNRINAQAVIAAARLVRQGRTINLDLPLGAMDPPIGYRTPPVHEIFSTAPYHRDDRLDGFYLQASSQIDSLRHHRHPLFDFYNGVPESAVVAGTPSLGINRIAERGIVGRGVLIDIGRHLVAAQRPLDLQTSSSFTVADLQDAAATQGVAIARGDIVLVRTGWLGALLATDGGERAARAGSPSSPGLVQSEETMRWLWDSGIAMIVSDTIAVEAFPPVADSPYATDPSLDALVGNHRGMIHPLVLGLLGMPLGELWWLDGLADDCVADGVWEFMLCAHPLNLIGGVGSPANAYAIK